MSALKPHPARATPLVSKFAHTVHSYHGICPWSRDGRRLLYLGFDRLPGEGAVIVRDLASGQEQVVATTTTFNYHCAAWQHWVLDDTAIAYRVSGSEDAARTAITDLVTGQTRLLPGLVRELRHVSNDSRRAYATTRDSDGPAVSRIDLGTGEVQRLLGLDDAIAALPESLRDPQGRYGFSHPVPNDGETRLFVKLEGGTRPWPRDEQGMVLWGAILILDLQDGRLRSLGHRVSGHPIWMADDRHILNIKQTLDGADNRWLVLIDSETGQHRRVVDLPIEGPGHPAPSPDGQWIVTDAYTADREACPVYLVHLDTGITKEVARLRHRVRVGSTYDPSTILRANPHPVWSPDGRQVLVNCNHGGERMQLLVLDSFMAGPAQGPV